MITPMMARLRSRIFGASGIGRGGMLTTPSPSTPFSGSGVISQLPGRGGSPSAQVTGTRSLASTFDSERSNSVFALTDGGRQLASPDPAGELAVDLAGLADDVPVFTDHRSPGGRPAVTKNRDGAPTGLGGDGGDVVEKCRARFAVIHRARSKASSQHGTEQALKILGIFGRRVELIAAATKRLGAVKHFAKFGKLVGTVLASSAACVGRSLGRFGLLRGGYSPSVARFSAKAFFSHWSISWCICSGVTIIVPFLIRPKTSGSPTNSRSWKSLWNLRKSSGLVAALLAGVAETVPPGRGAAWPTGGDFSHFAISRSMSPGVRLMWPFFMRSSTSGSPAGSLWTAVRGIS